MLPRFIDQARQAVARDLLMKTTYWPQKVKNNGRGTHRVAFGFASGVYGDSGPSSFKHSPAFQSC